MTEASENPGWRIQLAVHRAVRRDVQRLVGALAQGRGTSPQAVRTYWGDTAFQLNHHHEFEDTVIWPLLGERLGDRVESLLVRNAGEHVAMAAAMASFADAVATTTSGRSAARMALRRMKEAIETHLAHEEADVLPLIPEAFTLDDIKFFQAESAKENAPSAFLPWIFDDAPEADVVFLTGPMPAAVQAELELSWLPQRQAKVDALGLRESAVATP